MTEQPAVISVPQYRILFTAEAARIFWYLIDKAPGEISMLASVVKNGLVFRITEIHFKGLKQRNTSASTEILPQAIDKFIVDREMAGLDNSALRGSLHSHGLLQVFWSSIDDTNIERFEYCPWLVSVVVNKNKNVLGRIDIFNPLRMTIDHVQVGIEQEEFPKELQSELDTNYNEAVEEQTVTEYPMSMNPAKEGSGSNYYLTKEANGNGNKDFSRRELKRARALREMDEAAIGEMAGVELFPGNDRDGAITKKFLNSVLDTIDTLKKDFVILANKVVFMHEGKAITEDVEDMVSRYADDCLDVLEEHETEINAYIDDLKTPIQQESFSFGDRLT